MDPSAEHNFSDTVKEQNSFWRHIAYNGSRTTTDTLLLRQLFFINTFSFIGSFAAVSIGLLNIVEKNYQVGIPDLLTGIVFLLNLLLLRLGKNIIIAKTIMLATLGTLLLVILATGGTGNTGIYWFFTFPIAAFFLMGRVHGIVWILFLCCATSLITFLGTLEYVSLAYSIVEIRQMFLSLAIISLLIYLYQYAIEDTEEQIKQEKVKDDALLASIGEGVVAIDKEGKILVMNTTAKQLLKIEEKEVKGESFTKVVSLKDPQGKEIMLTDRPWYRAVSTGQSIRGDYTIARNDGTDIPIALVVTPVILNGKTIGCIALFRDVTQEKELDRAKSEFIALASHQLRTPISAISWFTEMLINGDSGPLTEEQKQHLTQVYQSNERMAELVTSLLYVSQLDLRNVLIKPEPVDLKKMSHSVLTEELKKHQMRKYFTIEEQYDDHLSAVSLDPEIMKIIFQNLFSNAIKYTRDKGKIRIEISSGQTSVKSGNNKEDGILITVKDTGIGIPKRQEEKIFQKLFRADNARAIDTDGTGLGLYIIKAILEEAGGEIGFESEENKGSTFFVWLPKAGMKEKKPKD